MEDEPSRGARGRRRCSSESSSERLHGKILKREAGEGGSNRDPQPGGSRQSGGSGQPGGSRQPGGSGDSFQSAHPSNKRADRRERYEIVQTRSVDSKVGKLGNKVMLKTNFFRLVKKPTWRIHQYHVSFEPDIDLVRVKRGVLSEHKLLFGGYLFDGTKMFTTTKLMEDNLVLDTKSRSGDVYKITIKAVGTISMTESQSLQVLNLILRRSMEGLQLQLIGRNFFDAVAKIDIREFRLQLWPGYTTSIRQYEKDIMLCAEIAHKVMRQETVYDILKRCSSESRGDYQDSFKRQVIGLTVLTDYNNKTYRVDDVDFTKDPSKTFPLKKGNTVTYMEYYSNKYKIHIRDRQQPLLISKCKDRQIRVGQDDFVLLIPELCRVTGLSEQMRSNFQLTRALSQHTRMDPQKRMQRLEAFNNRLQTTAASMEMLQSWNMSLDRRLVEVPGRIIEAQNIVLYDRKKVHAGDSADWSQCFQKNRMFTQCPRGLERWSVIVPSRSLGACTSFLQALERVAQGLQITMRSAREHVIRDDRNHSYVQAIEEEASRDPQLIMCLVPNNAADRYNIIKKKTCVERAIPTQVITYKTATNRSLLSIATKVAIQINCKMGFAPWMIDLPLSGLMTIGYDISRSNMDKSKAYGALVASMDMKTNATFFSTIAECHGSDLLSNELTISVTKALRQYKKEHSELPKKILLYRDSVGEGSLKQLVDHEVKTLVTKLEKIYQEQGKELALAFIVVSKQVNTRFFLRERNPQPGTIIDDIVTLPEHYDFYLVSQSVRQGTVSPTYYNVVYSSIKLSPDQLQILTYKMTHLYYNWAGTTRVPAVCQYAKKLATLVSQSINSIPTNALEKKLYYL